MATVAEEVLSAARLLVLSRLLVLCSGNVSVVVGVYRRSRVLRARFSARHANRVRCDCCKTYSSADDIRFHNVPHEPDRRVLWLRATGRDDSDDIGAR
ncbi:hypothetical protein HPB47_012348, partial [Ixodes persulcatus]